jgi:hypothetical protein
VRLLVLVLSLGALRLGLAREQRLGSGALLLGLLDQAPRLLRQPRVLLRHLQVLGLAAGAGQHVGLVRPALVGGAPGQFGGFAPGFGSLARGQRLLLGGALLGLRRLALGVLPGRLGLVLVWLLGFAGALSGAGLLASAPLLVPANFSAILCAASLARAGAASNSPAAIKVTTTRATALPDIAHSRT